MHFLLSPARFFSVWGLYDGSACPSGFPKPFRGFLKESIYNHIPNAIHSTSQDPRQSRGVLAALKLANASDGLSFLFGCSFI